VAIRAYYFAKWTQTEIAQHLDCSQRWASALIERGEVAFIQHLCGG
jgi:DNA-binding transcriptional regulator LsrR (DeoR family)